MHFYMFDFFSLYWPHFYQTRSAWSVDQGSNKNHSPAYNFAPTVTKFCVMWEGLSLPHDTKFGNCRCKIVDSRSFPSWSLIHGLCWSGLIKVGPGVTTGEILCQSSCINSLRLRRNRCHFADYIFKCIVLMKMHWFWLKFHWNLVPRVQLTIFQPCSDNGLANGWRHAIICTDNC